jgi:hypothetical protein
MSQEKCERCLTGTEDVKAVQFRKPGMAHDFIPKKVMACRRCREATRGSWRYWR